MKRASLSAAIHLLALTCPIAAQEQPLGPGADRSRVWEGGISLSYVESSTGLSNPAMESGNTELEFGDVNGDGHVDLVCVGDHGSPFVNTQQHGVMVWFGDGTGSWSVFQVGNFGYGGVALGDANGDGLMDVGYGVHHDYSSNDLGDQLLEVALGDGSGEAWTAWDDGLASNGETWGMFGTDFADVDNDGDLDVGSVSFGCCAGLHVYLNQGDGTWVQSFGFVGSNSTSQFLFDDLDNDGHADMLAGHQLGAVWFGDGTGSFTAGDSGLTVPFGGFSGFDAGDLDGDGDLELAIPAGSSAVGLWQLQGGTWVPFPSNLPSGSGFYQATQIADMNVDGLADVVTFGSRVGVVWAGDGQGGFAEAAAFLTPSPGSATALRAGVDADHNGLPDIAVLAKQGSRNVPRFFAEASEPPVVWTRIVRPSNGRVLRAGSVRFVDWVSAVPGGRPSTVDLALSVSGSSGPWTPIASAVPDNGRYQWIVPSTPSTDCRLRITVRVGARVVRARSEQFEIR